LPPFDTFDRVDSGFNRNDYMTCHSPFPTVSEMATFRFGPSPIQDDDGGLTLATGDGEGVTLAPTTPGITDNCMDIDDDIDNPETEMNINEEIERDARDQRERDGDQVSLPVYNEAGGVTPEPTRIDDVVESKNASNNQEQNH